MAAAAETAIQTEPWIEQEEYAHSLMTIKRMGGLAVEGVVEHVPARELALADFTTAVTEMLKTDSEFRECLDIDNRRKHYVIDGKACAADGTPMVSILETGRESSRHQAQENEALEAQVIRDSADVFIANRVDALLPDKTLLTLSMEPKKELKKYHKEYRQLGYREGLAYIQTYSKSEDGQVVESGSYSVDMSDESVWRELFAELGVAIPDGESSNIWIKNYAELDMDAQQADKFAKALREEAYKKAGIEKQRFSATEYVVRNAQIVEDIFDTYYPYLSEALNTGQNNERLQSLALATLQKDPPNLKASVKHQLTKIASSAHFDSEAGKIKDSIIRYATVEELRKGLKVFVRIDRAERDHVDYANTPAMFMPAMHPEAMSQRLAGNVECGVRAGRSYGGCAGQIELNLNPEEESNNPQEAYGGKDCPEIKDGQRVRCPHCRKEVRAIVPDKESIYCSNKECKLAAPDLAHKD